jgi:hypothetical protein
MSSTKPYSNRMRALRPYVEAIDPRRTGLANAIYMAYGSVRTKVMDNIKL